MKNDILFPYKYVVFEGITGVGKTKFIDKLSKKIDLKYVKNPNEENPFLENFFKDIEGFAFQTQLFFLLSRYKQQTSEIKQLDLFNQTIICDYLFDRDRIFAKLTLSENEFSIYDQIFKMFTANIRKPDLVIYLQARVESVLKKIRNNKIYINKYISPKFIQDLVNEYNKYFFYYESAPLLIVETSNIDFEDDNVFNEILDQIVNLESTKKFYNPVQELKLF